MNSVDGKSWHRTEESGKLQSTHTKRSSLKRPKLIRNIGDCKK